MKTHLIIATLSWVVVTAAPAAPSLAQVDVFVSGTDGYHTFRIPAIETAADGSRIALAEARKYTAEDPGLGQQDIDLVDKCSTDEGKSFSQEKILPTDFAAYSEMTVLQGNSVGVIWERGTEKSDQFITFTRVNQEWMAPPLAAGRTLGVQLLGIESDAVVRRGRTDRQFGLTFFAFGK
ncbi:MAG: exo-alpha-sialidase [Opitutus sp.]|nr:exo-alpha-sialidase [Opitutus sp.]